MFDLSGLRCRAQTCCSPSNSEGHRAHTVYVGLHVPGYRRRGHRRHHRHHHKNGHARKDEGAAGDGNHRSSKFIARLLRCLAQCSTWSYSMCYQSALEATQERQQGGAKEQCPAGSAQRFNGGETACGGTPWRPLYLHYYVLSTSVASRSRHSNCPV
ncbi:uncharacterized protein [Dermacentor albipictus]|uniref:uncharacterized protein n=1 Tax=Dermacentor albipictus TaxID=60249 RepID=UPI0038FC1F6E